MSVNHSARSEDVIRDIFSIFFNMYKNHCALYKHCAKIRRSKKSEVMKLEVGSHEVRSQKS